VAASLGSLGNVVNKRGDLAKADQCYRQALEIFEKLAPDSLVLLIKSGADVNAQGDLGMTPLHHAASRGLLEIAKKLTASGANPLLKNEFGQTPADIAIFRKQTKVAKLLKEK
jgi:ankyrin repeat protein